MRPLFTALLFVAAASGCGGKQTQTVADKSPVEPEVDAAVVPAEPSCPKEQPAADLLPGVSEAHKTAEYWLEQNAKSQDLDKVLMSIEEIRRLNSAIAEPRPGFFPQQDLLIPTTKQEMQKKIEERFAWMQGKLDSGEYRKGEGSDPFVLPADWKFASRMHVALEEVPLYCAAAEVGFFDSDAINERIDRNRCSNAHPQELIEVLASWPGDLLLARTATSWGFVPANASLSKPLDKKSVKAFANGPYAVFQEELHKTVGGKELVFPARTRLPYVRKDQKQAWAFTKAGAVQIPLAAQEHVSTVRPLTRRNAIEEVMAYIGRPYGFGGLDGGIDCSRLMLDVFGSFGLRLPRFSGWQAKAGTYSIDVSGLNEGAKQEIIDQAHASGIVLMQLPGHIMMYLGRDEGGTPMAVHALAYYLDHCEDGQETAMQVGQVQVGSLELGRDTRKTALIERISRITVLGAAPPRELEGIAEMRPAAPVVRPSERVCKKHRAARMHAFPKKPDAGRPLTVVASSREDRAPATLALFDSKGRRASVEVVETGGPPHAWISQVQAPRSGSWTAVLGDGEDVYLCSKIRVRSARRPRTPSDDKKDVSPINPDALPEGFSILGPDELAALSAEEKEAYQAVLAAAAPPVWKVKKNWGPMYEDLFATFVERLFDYPKDSDQTWPNLHTLLRDKERNFLYDYFGDDEEELIKLVPDCADLPYALRAYFAWKMALPFGMHDCHRARENRPPTCDLGESNLMSTYEFPDADSVSLFSEYVNKKVRRTVHSSSGRTAPDDDVTDFYPISLSRKTLRPGTLFTDPYGHLLVIVDWIEQGATGYGALIGADAQPDGTIGRRRFWQGSFLFRPETRSGGAGFKAFRPWVYDKDTGLLEAKTNKDLRRDRTARYSREQYLGSEADFYDKMESIINPRPLDPKDKMVSLVDALFEQVTRRRTSVETGEEFMKSRNFAPIDMPKGSKIFLTSGPWEDFATPSRDWRLLIAIHTVVDFPAAVERSPAQYGFSPKNAKAARAELQAVLDKELAKRTLKYKRSDGSSWEISLKDLVDRRVEFETSYNPNDCPETRWAAPKGSEEASTCTRKAPEDQQQKMQEYRPWFANRRRPAS